jgi:hypothetical protein
VNISNTYTTADLMNSYYELHTLEMVIQTKNLFEDLPTLSIAYVLKDKSGGSEIDISDLVIEVHDSSDNSLLTSCIPTSTVAECKHTFSRDDFDSARNSREIYIQAGNLLSQVGQFYMNPLNTISIPNSEKIYALFAFEPRCPGQEVELIGYGDSEGETLATFSMNITYDSNVITFKETDVRYLLGDGYIVIYNNALEQSGSNIQLFTLTFEVNNVADDDYLNIITASVHEFMNIDGEGMSFFFLFP